MSITTKGIKWGYGVQSALGTAVAASGGLRCRAEGGITDFKPNMTHVDAPLQDGTWGRHDYTEVAGISKPTLSFPGILRPGLLQMLLQQVCDEAVDGDIYTYTLKDTGCNPLATAYLSLIRCNDLASSKDKRMTDGIIKSIKLSSSEGNQKVAADLEFLGSALAYTYDGSGDVYTLPTESFLLHKGLTFKIGAAATRCAEYDVAIDPGIVGIVDDAAAIQEFILGEFKCEGTIRIPWADEDVLNDFMTSVANTLIWEWGTGGVSGHCKISIPVKYNEPDEDVDNDKRLRQGMPFKFAETSSQEFEVVLTV